MILIDLVEGTGYGAAPAAPLPALRRELYAADALRPPPGSLGDVFNSFPEKNRL